MQALYAIIKAFEFVYHETMTPIHIGLRFSVIMYISDSYVDSKKKKSLTLMHFSVCAFYLIFSAIMLLLLAQHHRICIKKYVLKAVLIHYALKEYGSIIYYRLLGILPIRHSGTVNRLGLFLYNFQFGKQIKQALLNIHV